MPVLAFLFGGSKLGKIALIALGVLTLGVGAVAAKALYDAKRRREGAERERQGYRKRADEIREGMIRAPQHNEEGAANELDQGRY